MMALPAVIGATLVSLLVLTSCDQANTEVMDGLELAMAVDTKIWLGNTELGERSNWRNGLMPCTLLERIQLNEKAVVSMGDVLDYLESSLESNGIRELGLARDGVLLLEEDTLGDFDPSYVEFLNKVGQCFDSDLNNQQQQQQQQGEPLFVFEPESDSMSWFNPANWLSSLLGEPGSVAAELAPDSHRIPCSEDVVVLGSRSTANITLTGGERAQTLSFKVNFRASQAERQGRAQLAPIANVRVSKLRLGEHFYDQQQLDSLLRSPDYANLLFQLQGDPANLLQSATGLVIDPSSIDPSQELCLEEAGCYCGNEQARVMDAICSFSQRLRPDQLPCRDPISSSGYCDKICATVLTISMEPSKFKESFLINLINTLVIQHDLGRMYVASRRTDISRFEITFRPLADGSTTGWSAGSNERLFGQLVHDRLNAGKWCSVAQG